MAERTTERAHSIVDGVLVRSSVSQVETHQLCNLKWWYGKVARFPTKPPGKGARTGLENHAQYEHYLKTGNDVRGRLARESDPFVDHLRDRIGKDLLIEVPLENPELRTPKGILIVGYADVVAPPLGDDDSIFEVEIIDHKFSKDVEKYGTKKEELPTDVQANVYSKWALNKWPNAPGVMFALHQHQYEGRQYAIRVAEFLGRASVETQWAAIASHIDNAIATDATKSDPADVAFDESACSAFGGCDFASMCPHSPTGKFLSAATPTPTTKEKKMGLLGKLTEVGGSEPPKKITIIDESGTVVAANAKEESRYILPDGRLAVCQAKSPSAVFFAAVEDGAAVRLGVDAVLRLPPPPPAPAVTTINMPTTKVEVRVLPPDAPKSQPEAAAEPLRDALAAEPAEVVEEKKPRAKAKAAKTTELSEGGDGGFAVFVNCAFSPGLVGVIDGDRYAADIAAKVAKAAGVEDVRMAPNGNPLAFGAWKGALAKAALQELPKQHILFHSSDLADPIIEALSSGVALYVVRGVGR